MVDKVAALRWAIIGGALPVLASWLAQRVQPQRIFRNPALSLGPALGTELANG